MMISCIFINGPGDGALINFVHLRTLKFGDTALSLLNTAYKVLLEVHHDNRKSIVNTNIKSIGIKPSFAGLVYVVSCIINAGDVWRVSGGGNMVIL